MPPQVSDPPILGFLVPTARRVGLDCRPTVAWPPLVWGFEESELPRLLFDQNEAPRFPFERVPFPGSQS